MATQADRNCTQASLSDFLLPEHEAGLTRVPVFANYFGVMMMTDSLDAAPRMAVPSKQASVLTFASEERGDVAVDSVEDVWAAADTLMGSQKRWHIDAPTDARLTGLPASLAPSSRCAHSEPIAITRPSLRTVDPDALLLDVGDAP
jgi:hypothetical protein